MKRITVCFGMFCFLVHSCGSDNEDQNQSKNQYVEDNWETSTEESEQHHWDKNGEACIWDVHDTCGEGLYCHTYRDAPIDPDAKCVKGNRLRVTRLLGTVWDFESLISGKGYEPVPGATVHLGPALDTAANADLSWANPLETARTDELGHYDFTIDLEGIPLGVVASNVANGYYRSANGVAVPLYPQPEDCFACYGAGADAHDTFAIREELLDAWSNALSENIDYVRNRLPLGKRGGTIGVVRKLETGEPIRGAQVKSQTNGKGQVRYINEDLRSFNTEGTTATGAFVIIGPSLAEGFNVEIDGVLPSPHVNFAGSTPNAVLVMVFNMP